MHCKWTGGLLTSKTEVNRKGFGQRRGYRHWLLYKFHVKFENIKLIVNMGNLSDRGHELYFIPGH